MKITIHAIGLLKESYWREAESEYLKRLKPYCEIKIEEYPDLPSKPNASKADEEKVKQKEGEKVLRKLKPSDFVCALDLNQKEYGSEEFASSLEKMFVQGGSSIHFLIGGSLGLSDELKKRADVSISISKMTFTHQMSRIILLEQIYRCFRILGNEPYHK